MDPVSLARMQFGIVTVYHFFFVPLTLGLSLFLAILETLYVKTGKKVYKDMTKFWGKLFLINFAMGVVTGIVQEFQFGMNWSEYSRFVGDIFGAPLAIEALLAFFLESTFIGLWVFGWDKLSPKLHALTIWLVAFGSAMSAYWIIVASSFMHYPVGYAINNGRAEMQDFLTVVTNPHALLQFPHIYFAGMCTAAFFVMGISAWHFMRKSNNVSEFFPRSFRIAAIFGIIGILGVIGIGHTQAQFIIKNQPMKMAAAEALWHTENPASFALFSIDDEENKSNIFSIRIPYALSFLAHNTFSGEVKGIHELQKEFSDKYGSDNYIPPVALNFWCFRLMLFAGGVMLLLNMVALYKSRGNKIPQGKILLTTILFAISLPYLANSTGWIMTEMGRQPWIVYGLMKTQEGVSISVSAVEVLISLVVFTLLYGALMVADVWLLVKFAKEGPATIDVAN